MTEKQLNNADKYFVEYQAISGQWRLRECINIGHARNWAAGRAVVNIYAYFNGQGFWPVSTKDTTKGTTKGNQFI